MKLKATVSDVLESSSNEERYALAQLVIALNGPSTAALVLDQVLIRHLRVPPRDSEDAWGPADFFDQETDRMIPWDTERIGVDVTLSGISVTARRAPADFWKALSALKAIYVGVLEQNVLWGQKAQLLVRLALDKPIEYLDRQGATSLLEEGPIWIVGKAKTEAALTPEVLLTVELEARLGIPTARLLLSVLRESGGITLPLLTRP